MSDWVPMRGPVSVANLAAAAGALTGDDGYWWPCLNITFRTPVPPSITKITAQVREKGADGRYSQPAEQVLTKDEIAAGEAKIVNGVGLGEHLQIRLSPAGAPGLPFQATPWLDVTAPWDAIMREVDGLTVGCAKWYCGEGEPTRTDVEIPAFYAREDVSQLWHKMPNGGLTVHVTGVAASGGGIPSVTLSGAPAEGNTLVAMCISYSTPEPDANTSDGWTEVMSAHDDISINEPATRMAWKLVGPGESATQTPFEYLATPRAFVAVWEVEGLDPTFTPSLIETFIHAPTLGGSSVTITDASPQASLYLFMGGALPNSAADFGVGTPSGDLTIGGTDHTGGAGGSAAHLYSTSTPSSVTQTLTFGAGTHVAAIMASFALPAVSVGYEDDGTTETPWRRFSDLTRIQDEGVLIEDEPFSMNFTGAGVSASSDGAGNITVDIDGYTDEQVRDVMGAALAGGTGITVTPNDGADTISIASTITQYTDEMARDAIGAALVAGSNITITVNDAGDTITIGATGGGSASTYLTLVATDPNGSAISTGDGKAVIPIDASLSGKNIIGVSARVTTVSSSGAVNVQLRRVRSGASVDTLSTALTIDASEKSSTTAATPAVINGSNDDLATDDELWVDIDGAGTGAKGLSVTVVVQ